MIVRYIVNNETRDTGCLILVKELDSPVKPWDDNELWGSRLAFHKKPYILIQDMQPPNEK